MDTADSIYVPTYTNTNIVRSLRQGISVDDFVQPILNESSREGSRWISKSLEYETTARLTNSHDV